MEKKIDIGKKGKILVELNATPTEHTNEDLKNIARLVAKKYGLPVSSVNVTTKSSRKAEDRTSNGLNATDAKNIQDPKFQAELIKQYITDNKFEGVDIDEVLKIDSQINSLIDYSVYEKSKRYQIKWVKWDNFLSYGADNFFDFTKLKGLVLLNGEPANKSGKSTFAYDLLHFLLFGKTNPDKAKVNEHLFNNYRPGVNEVTVEGCICIDGEDYVIKRVVSKKGKTKITVSQKVSYYHVVNGVNEELVDYENLKGETTAQTNKIIKEALGNEKDFDLIISANSKDLDELISMGDTDRGKILTRWIGLSPIEDKEIAAKNVRKAMLKNGRYCDLYNKVAIQTSIEETNETIKDIKESISKTEASILNWKQDLLNYTTEEYELIASREKIEDVISNLDLETLQNNLNSIVEKGKRNNDILASIKSEIDEIPVVDFDQEEYDSKVSRRNEYIETIAEIKAEINSLKRTNDLLQTQEFCPTCGKKLDNVDNSGQIQENTSKINKLIAKGSATRQLKEEADAYIESMNDAVKNIAKKSKLELKASAINVEIIEGRNQYREVKQAIDNLKKNEEAVRKNNEIDAKINVVRANKATCESTLATFANNIATWNLQIQNCEQQNRDREAMLVTIDNELKIERNWNAYLKAIGKDGISKMVLRHALPIINCELKNLLSDATDFDVEVRINNDNLVEFWLIRDGVETRLSASSGLERTQASLALRVVLGMMSRLSCPPFIFLDEILGTVATEYYDDIKKLYDKIVPLYDFVLHITHLDDIVDWHDMIVTVVKKDNISSVKPLVKK